MSLNMKNIKPILDLMHKNEIKKNLEQIKWQAFQQWLRKDLIGDSPGVADGLYKPQQRYVPGPE